MGRTEELTKRALMNEKKIENKVTMRKEDIKSVKQLLLERLQKTTSFVKIPFGDTDIEIEVRHLSPKEQIDISNLQINLLKFKSKGDKLPSKKDDIAIDQAKKLVNSGRKLLDSLFSWVGKVCIDPELNEKYWSSGNGFNSDVPAMILSQTILLSQKSKIKMRSNVKRFRENKRRKRFMAIPKRNKKNT